LKESSMATPLSETDLQLINRYWHAANYLSVGQIYLLENPLLREPLRPEHIKPRLLGHWGTTPASISYTPISTGRSKPATSWT
jgi:xylulose-5-phosphate/fructose-6-phosphate phosphoketolase